MDVTQDVSIDLGWRTPDEAKRKRRKSKAAGDDGAALDDPSHETAEAAKVGGVLSPGVLNPMLTNFAPIELQEHRTRLLKELSARLVRDRQLRYAERELEMQRLLMGKGASKKLSGVEKMDDDRNEEDEEDASRPRKVDEKTWKPRVYKWRVERKR